MDKFNVVWYLAKYWNDIIQHSLGTYDIKGLMIGLNQCIHHDFRLILG